MTDPTLRFDGEVALVTGAGAGLGRAYALQLAARGASVVVNDLRGAREVVEEITASGGKALADTHSVTDGATAMVEATIERFGRLDIVINNAGISGGGALFHQISEENWNKVVDIHLGGTVAVGRAAWAHLAQTGNGRLINTSSSATFGGQYNSPYATAKAAIYTLTKCQAAEGAAAGVRVAGILPNAFTPMTAQIPDKAYVDFKKIYLTVERVAAFAVWLAHRDTTIRGHCFSVGGGRAAPVVLAEPAGVYRASDAPEAWVGQETALMALQPLSVPQSMLDESAFIIENLSQEARDAFKKVDWGKSWLPKKD